MHNITIVLPTYNEVENLPLMIEQLLALEFLQEAKILVVDDNSPDGTGKIADELSKQHPRQINVLHRQTKEGLGPAYIAGFKEAIKNGAEYIVQMDCDFSHDPKYIKDMLQAMNKQNADLVIGSRYIKGGSVDKDWGFYRKLLSWGANSVYIRVILGFGVKDATAGFRLWKRATLEKIGLDSIKSNGYIFQVEMAYVTYKNHLNIVEIPIYFPERKKGKSKMVSNIVIEAAIKVLQLKLRK